MITSQPSWAALRLDHALAVSRAEQRAALGLYLPVGYPTRQTSLDALHLMAQSADFLELGVPHTPAHLDGPLIQQAAAQALAQGFVMQDLFDAAVELTASTTTALLVMSYWQPIARYGAEAFVQNLAAAGAAGVLIPDLPADCAAHWRHLMAEAGLHPITLIPPHASAAHLAFLATCTSGMVYAPATPGLTGARRPLSPYLPRLVHRLRTATGLPVAVGIGISSPAQATQASAYADAVVVGSAVIRRMHGQPDAAAVAAARAASDFAAGVRRAHTSPA
ncbi:tryptophan synthase subunit alpha [Streptomyces sp. NPDC005799]|uniref:tryptophan synthase subunit alpha n=1 Tax=Streptomyces sp. NPDC005799 TaxID=3154678 RepID=UPI0033E2E440